MEAHEPPSLFSKRHQQYGPKGHREESLWLNIAQSTLDHHVWTLYTSHRKSYSWGHWYIQGLRQLAGSSDQLAPFAKDYISFSTERPSSWKAPQSWAHWVGQSPSLALPGEGVCAASGRPVQTPPSLAIALKQEKDFCQTRMELRELKLCCLDVPKISKGLSQIRQQSIFSSKA